ncbi:helicase-related protein [Aquibium oceanicum]|uniref:Helicase n=1 Tax=Aquibium oceanicum TaxID=1670800 RepID=A0A1L3SKS9_9HYPH|nr:helicase-related protein [Aquibium oceanicum]APH69988.1 helicase [Aquibium oceanicum]
MNVHTTNSAPLILSGRDVTAVLGPTNTGKTHLAIERMVAHSSGVIGLPLRLLAREVYGRVAERVGTANVALITGEEKIQPPGARYSVCTVEAMPRETSAAFVAIDEVQLAGDLERGHVFTDRILHLRGRDETLLLGAATMAGILQKLLKGVSVVTRPRMSHLAYAGSKKITRLPRRSAIVAFSADEVYGIAELIRRQRGGAAVVLGALSPRTRNAQVEIYQSGDVDFLVATDAIGMGLNLDVDHVGFAQNRKFDGFQYRQLSAAELGQIAGRAGRHMRDGTFGVTGQVDPFDDELVEKIEGHDFDPVRVLQWRTAQFDFSSLDALKRSVETPAPVEGLTKALPAVDAQALDHVTRDDDIRALADHPQRVALLWEACALPDYRRIAPAQHADLIASIFSDLARRGHVDETYMAEQVRRADTTDGDIDTLSQRIAQIRTWTFVSHRPGWLADPAHWQEKTREIEDRLSDALHERLTKRFVDRRTSVLMRRLRENTMLEAEINPAGEVLVEGHHVGELQGFRFTADQSAGGEDAKAVRAAAQKALATEFENRAERFAAAGNGDFALGSDGILRWIGAPIATLVAGDDVLKPRVVLFADEQLTGPSRDKVVARIERYANYQIESLLKPLLDLRNAEQLSGMARGVAFRLVENLGIINRRDIADEIKGLDQEARAALRRLGVRFGAYHIFIPLLLKPGPAGLVTLLWALANEGKDKPGFGDVVNALATGRTSLVVDATYEKEFYRLAGYRLLGRRAVRVDILERLADLIRPALSWRPGTGKRPEGAYDGAAFIVTPPMMSILGATAEDMEEILKGLGYRGEPKPAADVKSRLESLDEAARKAAADEAAKKEADAAQALADAATAALGENAEGQPQNLGEAAQAATTETPDSTSPKSDGMDAAAEAAAAALGTSGEGEPQNLGEAAAESTSDADASSESPSGEGSLSETAAAALGEHDEGEPQSLGDAAADAQADEAFPAQENAPATDETAAPASPVLSAEPPEAVAAQAAEPDQPATSETAPLEAATWAPAPDAAAPVAGVASEPAGDPVAASASAVEAPTEEVEEEKPIILWRPGRFGDRQRNRNDNRGRNRRNDREAQPERQRRDGQPDRQKPEGEGGKGRFERRFKDKQGRGKPDGRNGEKGERRPVFQQKPREERPAKIDPDSPFAKLAALRDKLKK